MNTNSSLQKRKEQVIARGQGNLAQVYVDRAQNAELWDVEGKRYLDFGTGIAVVNTGHGHPKVSAAVKDQIDRFKSIRRCRLFTFVGVCRMGHLYGRAHQ